MNAIERMIQVWRDCGWGDNKIWLHRKFMSKHSQEYSYQCQWCGIPENLLYLVPGRTPDGRMNWVCEECAVARYETQIEAEMAQYAHIQSGSDGMPVDQALGEVRG